MKLMLRTLFSFGLAVLAFTLSSTPASSDGCSKRCEIVDLYDEGFCQCQVATSCPGGAVYYWYSDTGYACGSQPSDWCVQGSPGCPGLLAN